MRLQEIPVVVEWGGSSRGRPIWFSTLPSIVYGLGTLDAAGAEPEQIYHLGVD